MTDMQQMGANTVEHALTDVVTGSWDGQEKALVEALELLDRQYSGTSGENRSQSSRGSLSNVHGDESLQWLLLQRLKVLQHLDRLHVVVFMCNGRWGPIEQELYFNLRDADVGDVARECAMVGEVESLVMLLQCFPYSLIHQSLDILSATPETVELKHIERVIYYLLDQQNAPELPRAKADWAECEESCSYLRQIGHANMLCTEHMAKLNYGWCSPQPGQIASWIVVRAFAVDRVTGMYVVAMKMLMIGIRLLGHDDAGPVVHALLAAKAYNMLIELLRQSGNTNRGAEKMENQGISVPKSMEDFALSSVDERMECIMCAVMDQGVEHIMRMTNQYISPYFEIENQIDGKRSPGASVAVYHLCSFVVKHGYSDLEWTFVFLKNEFSQLLICESREEVANICYDVVFSANAGCDTSSFEFQHRLIDIAALTMSSESGSSRPIGHIQSKLSMAMSMVTAAQELCSLGCPMNARSAGDLKPETALDYIKSIFISKERREQIAQHEWSGVWDSLEILFGLDLASFPRDSIVSEFCKAALRVGLIDLAREKMGLLPKYLAEKIVVETAQELILSGSSSNENSVMLAKDILDLVPDNEVAKKEKSFILAAIRLKELGIDVPPAQLRHSENSSQLFTSAIHNVTSTKGLDDIEGVIGISASLQTNFSAVDVLELLGGIAIKFQDINLCEKVASSLLSHEKSKQACEVVRKIVSLGLHKQNSKPKFVAFALSGISGNEILDIMESSESDSELQESLMDDILKADDLCTSAGKDIPQFDRQNLFIQISMGLYYSDPTKIFDLVSELIRMKNSLSPAIQYCCQTGSLAAISITVLMDTLKSQTGKEQLGIVPFDLLHISVKDLCTLASVLLSTKRVNMNEERVNRFSSLLQNLGELLVTSADESRVAILKDQDAYDLWATGDVDAQQNAIKQLTDRVAAKIVGKVGLIEGFESFDAQSDDLVEEEVGNQIHEISVLASRCGFHYQDIEKTYLSGVLYRHGASIAISKSWKSLVADDPVHAIEHVIEIFVQTDNFSNSEYCRLLEMMSFGFQSGNFDSITHDISREIYEGSVRFSKDLENVSLFLPLKPIIQRFAGIMRVVVVPEVSETDNLKEYIRLTANILTARAIFDYLKILSSSYTSLCPVEKQSIPCPKYPIRPELAITLAISQYIVNLDTINGNVLRVLLEKLDPCDLVEFAASVCLHIPKESLQFEDLQGPSTVPPGNFGIFISTVSTLIEFAPDLELSDAQKAWKVGIQRLFQEILLRAEIAKADYLDEEAVTQAQEMIHNVLLESSSEQQIKSIKDRIGHLMTSGYHFYPEVDFLIGLALPLVNDENIKSRGLLVDILQSIMQEIIISFTEETGAMSAGEAIQTIFGLVRSLDCNPPSMQSSCLEDLRSLVYSTIYLYIIEHQGGTDFKSSEIYSQLVEMALGLGKSKWDGWAPPEGEDQILTSESLMHSRFASFISSSWPGALKEASIGPDDLSDPEKVRQSMLALVNIASENKKIELLWQAFSSIILPQYESSGEITSISSTLKIFLEYLLKHGCFQSLLSALDIITTRLGDSIPSEIEELLLDSMSSNTPSFQAINLLLGKQMDEEGNSTLSWGEFGEILSDDQHGLLREATVLLIVQRSLVADLYLHDAKLFIKMCDFFFEGDISQQSAVYLSGDKEVFVPHGTMLAAHFIEQLLAANQMDGAAWIAYRQISLVSNLRVKDSRVPSIMAVLKPVANMQPQDSPADLELNIENFPVMDSFKMLLSTSRDSARKALTFL